MTEPSSFPGQLTKVLDTNTLRKRSLNNFYMMVVEVSKILGIPKEDQEAVFCCMLEITKKLAKVADGLRDGLRGRSSIGVIWC